MIFLNRNVIIQPITPTKNFPMSTDAETPTYTKSALEFKSSSFSVPVLVLYSTELKQIQHQLKEKISQAPEFFKNSPLLIDLKNCNDHEQLIDLAALIEFLHHIKLFPIGISGGSDTQNITAHKLHIPVHNIHGVQSASKAPEKNEPNNTPIKANDETGKLLENKLISQPVRSGQRIYAKGDLIILSHVSAGAEIMAEGNIHVYGALRGRALAGVLGDTESRIFCTILQAELVSIAGHYKTSEEFNKVDQDQPTQIFLQDQALIINNL